MARTLLPTLRRRLPRLARWAGGLRPRTWWRRWRLLGKDREQIFTYIFENELWDSSESVSGAGSTLEATRPLRRELPGLLSSLGIRSLLDAPCGDFNWMKDVNLDIDYYVGGDIVHDLVAELNEKYGNKERSFVHLDITSDPLPVADGFLCRDCLLHLSNIEVDEVLRNAVRSSCSYLLASTYTNCSLNRDITTGLSRPLNLCLPPFGLPEPLRIIADPDLRAHDQKAIGVWDLRLVRNQWVSGCDSL